MPRRSKAAATDKQAHTKGNPTQMDALQLIEGSNGMDYLARSIAIVSLLYERGILQELIDSGRIGEDEVQLRVDFITRKYPDFSGKFIVSSNESV